MFLKAQELIAARVLFERVGMLQRRPSNVEFHNPSKGLFRLEELSSMRSSPEQFKRRSELWFEDIAAWQQACRANPALWAPSKEGVPGFREFECMFLDIEPQYDLLQKAPPQEYKYITVPLKWAKGVPPEVEDTDDLVVNNYFFFYRPDVSITDGEDWYFGHHNREGRRTPGVKHYKSWKTLLVPEDPNSTLRPNK